MHAHDHSKLPKTYAAALDQLRSDCQFIDESLRSGTTHAADDKLHDLATLLEHLTEIASNSGIAGPDLAKIDVAKDKLFDALEVLHDQVHPASDAVDDDHAHDEHAHNEHAHDEHAHDEHAHDEHAHDEHAHDEQTSGEGSPPPVNPAGAETAHLADSILNALQQVTEILNEFPPPTTAAP